VDLRRGALRHRAQRNDVVDLRPEKFRRGMRRIGFVLTNVVCIVLTTTCWIVLTTVNCIVLPTY
jgi:hypothetical protein